MQLEIKVALHFIISYLYNKLPRRRADLFGEELERLLKKKYEGHWYPDRPLKGSGFRCVHIGELVDPVVELAARRSGLAAEDVRANVPEELSVWIDPFEVSYQIGEKGAVKVLYVGDGPGGGGGGGEGGGAGGGGGAPEPDKEARSSFNPDAQVFVPIGSQSRSLTSSPSPPFGRSPSPTFLPRASQPLTFTTASFAATKFGSTKMKKGGAGGGASAGGGGVAPRAAAAAASAARSPPASPPKPQGLALSVHPLSLLAAGAAPQSQLSPNAKEFVYSGGRGGSSSPGLLFDGAAGGTGTGGGFDVAQVLGGGGGGGGNANSLFLEKTPFVEGLSYNLNSMQYPSQPFQPVVLAN
ncbi:protein Tob2 isoform X2 [Perognathus longimembris pacificus]|uniref:protein Tob2 isoform X2 n=1 Tax=Perognathus longimembris pacificus TaxID=214514 RepID=UPI0020187BCF|nr:protein Tob2 isoform X2 [Perognathus longimembris pacificus]